jgi:hypothetical protein
LLSGTKTAGRSRCANIELRRALQLEQILGHQDADDVLPVALEHGETRVRGVDHQVQQGVVGRRDVDQVHARRSHHDIAGRHVRHADHAFEHRAALGVDHLVVLRLDQRLDQFLGRIRSGMNEFSQFLQEGALVFALGRTGGVRI